jgi:hypothetical protein
MASQSPFMFWHGEPYHAAVYHHKIIAVKDGSVEKVAHGRRYASWKAINLIVYDWHGDTTDEEQAVSSPEPILQDEDLEGIFAAAQAALDRAGIRVEEMLDDLEIARAEIVTEHYGEDFIRRLEQLRQGQLDTQASQEML